ncbi:DEAD/DEAH box helicase [Enterovirga sp. CN4-39]|uniref:DEAD/DEAH box helicase n=1 Tax=Enterovirga sp. CN4-39 TaxID=3400910 RepID=UPI003BFEE56E
MRTTPHDHQFEAVERLRQALLAGKRRPMLQAPTGFGKTLLGAMIVEGALSRGKRVIFTVPAVSLIDQTVEAFEAEGIDAIGVMQGFHPMSDARQPVQVCSVQTLMRRQPLQADVVLIDEAHRWFEFYGEWMNQPEWARVPFIGLSATPWTRGLGKFFDDLIVVRTTADLIDQGYLSPFRVFAPTHPDLKGVRTHQGDFHTSDLAEAMDKPHLVADVVSTWLARGEDRPTLCFAVNRAHAKRLQQQFEAADVPTGYVDYATTREEREQIRQAFQAGRIKVVCNVATLTTGIDWDVRCISLARPTKSRMLYVQIIGRGLRNAPGKADCLILDHSDTTLRLGFVTDVHQEHLDDGKGRAPVERKTEQPLPKECPQCQYLKKPKEVQCPSCGFKPERQSKVKCEDGELVELTRGSKRAQPSRAEKQRWFSMLNSIAAERRYSSGWVSQKYREKFGVWPRDLSHHRIPAEGDVLRWVRSRNIAWAKGRGAAHARAS